MTQNFVLMQSWGPGVGLLVCADVYEYLNGCSKMMRLRLVSSRRGWRETMPSCGNVPGPDIIVSRHGNIPAWITLCRREIRPRASQGKQDHRAYVLNTSLYSRISEDQDRKNTLVKLISKYSCQFL